MMWQQIPSNESVHTQSPEGASPLDFREIVMACARSPQLVESFNRACDLRLQTPVAALLEGCAMREISEEEQLVLGCFILFVHEQVWSHLKVTANRFGLRPARHQESESQAVADDAAIEGEEAATGEREPATRPL